MPDRNSSSSRRRRALLALLFYIVATLVLAAPLTWHFDDTVARAVRQDVWLNVWALAWTSEHLLTAPGSLFQANIYFPHAHTLAYTDHFIGEALLAAPVYWLTGSAVAGYNVAWVAALALTAWAGFLWVRSLIGDEPAGEAAALVAGAFCLMVPGKRTALSHLQVISLQGVPLALFAVHCLLRLPRARQALALAAATVYAALSSWYTAAYAALLLPAVGLGGLWIDTGVATTERRRIAAWGAVALLAAATVMIPVAQPFRAVQQELAFERPIEELVATSLRPVDFVASWSWLHAPVMPPGSGAGGYFPGFLAVVLALLGIRDGQRRKDRWPLFYALLAAGFALLALGPRGGPGGEVPLPYELLYRVVPGFGALRNPYRAAFIASLLLAVPVGYGARRLLEQVAGRWRAAVTTRRLPRRPAATQPGVLRPLAGAPATWGVALSLAALHLLEAWPGPQDVQALPRPPSAAYEWLAQRPEATAFVWPLPQPLDDNARYQLWTVGGWTPLVNGHSGLYPPDFTAMYRAGDEFPGAAFVARLQERFPVTHVVAHYGLAANGATARAAARANIDLEEVWAEGDDVIYRLGNGARGGWLRRRLPAAAIGDQMIVRLSPDAAGCRIRVSVDGTVVGEGSPSTGAPRGETTTAELSVGTTLSPRSGPSRLRELELELVDDSGGARFDVGSGSAPFDVGSAPIPEPASRLQRNGIVILSGAAVIAVVAGSGGDLIYQRAVAAEASRVATALRAALAAAAPGDELLVAVAEGDDRGLIERLRLLLDPIGVAVADAPSAELGSRYAVRGRVGGSPGSASEAFGPAAAEGASDDPTGDCRRAAILGFRFEGPGPVR